MAKYINPYTDFGFKKLFGEEANKDLLIDFLNQLLPPLSYLEVKEAINTAEMDGRKRREHEIARDMKEAGEPKEKIIKYTGLTGSEIDKL